MYSHNILSIPSTTIMAWSGGPPREPVFYKNGRLLYFLFFIFYEGIDSKCKCVVDHIMFLFFQRRVALPVCIVLANDSTYLTLLGRRLWSDESELKRSCCTESVGERVFLLCFCKLLNGFPMCPPSPSHIISQTTRFNFKNVIRLIFFLSCHWNKLWSVSFPALLLFPLFFSFSRSFLISPLSVSYLCRFMFIVFVSRRRLLDHDMY